MKPEKFVGTKPPSKGPKAPPSATINPAGGRGNKVKESDWSKYLAYFAIGLTVIWALTLLLGFWPIWTIIVIAFLVIAIVVTPRNNLSKFMTFLAWILIGILAFNIVAGLLHEAWESVFGGQRDNQAQPVPPATFPADRPFPGRGEVAPQIEPIPTSWDNAQVGQKPEGLEPGASNILTIQPGQSISSTQSGSGKICFTGYSLPQSNTSLVQRVDIGDKQYISNSGASECFDITLSSGETIQSVYPVAEASLPEYQAPVITLE